MTIIRRLTGTWPTVQFSPEHYGLDLTIANGEARLLEMANAYATLRHVPWGFWCRLLMVTRSSQSKKRLPVPATGVMVGS